jgi:DNA-binding transcriptional LysR family regulator
MIRFTLRQLEYAIAILDHGSVVAASASLGVAQPTLSASLAKLEDQVGLQLFIRHHALGVSVSPAGRRFLAEARNLIAHAQDVQRGGDVAGTGVEGTLNIGSFMTIAPAFAPRLISSFMALYPHADIRLEEAGQEHLFAGLRSGHHDLALLYDVDLPGDFETRELASIKPYLLLRAAHRFAGRRSVTLAELAEDPFILLDVAPSRTYFLRVLRATGVEPRIAFASPSLEVVRGLVGQGLGYSILITRPAGDRSYDGEALAITEIAGDTEPGVIALASLRQMRKTRLVSVFETHCAGTFNTFKRTT